MRHIFCILTAVFAVSLAVVAGEKKSAVSFEGTVVAIASIEGRIVEIDIEVTRLREPGEKLASDREIVRLTAERIRLEKQLKELRKQLPKDPPESPDLREARKRLEERDKQDEKAARRRAEADRKSAERAEKAQRDQENANARAKISGCPPGSVWVAREVARPTFGQYSVPVHILNNDPTYWVERIIDNHTGNIVGGNLCPGGTMTIRKIMPVMVNAYSIPVSFTAYGKMVDGRRITDDSPFTSLYLTWGGLQGQDQFLKWDICFGTVPCQSR